MWFSQLLPNTIWWEIFDFLIFGPESFDHVCAPHGG